MHRKTHLIIKNLGYSEDLIKKIKKEAKVAGSVLHKNVLTILEEAGTPDSALAQIKELEKNRKKASIGKKNNKQLIEMLIKRCKKSLAAFTKKGIPLVINFKNKKWTFDGDETDQDVQKLMQTCGKHFDEFAELGTAVVFKFDKNFKWTIITDKKGDLPDLPDSL